MEKLIVQGVVIVAIFFATYFALRQVDWMGMFKVEETTDDLEEKLGDLFWDTYRRIERESHDVFVKNTVDSLFTELCDANKIERSKFKLHILEKDEINAFALPGDHMVIYTGLIRDCDNEEELTGVIGHELAHLEKNHVMKRLVREVGLSTLVAMVSGSNSPEMIASTAKMLSSSAFDRRLEKEADITSIDYLIKADVNPEPFADFLYRMADHSGQGSEYMAWLSTHPESKERATYLIEYIKDKKIKKRKVLTHGTWERMLKTLETAESDTTGVYAPVY